MTKREIVKTGISLLVTASVGQVVGQLIKNNTDPSEKFTEEVKYRVGAFAIGGLVAAAAAEHTNKMVDEAVSLYHEHVKPAFKK